MTATPVATSSSNSVRDSISRTSTGGWRQTNAIWLLSGQVADGEPVRHVPIHASPFRIGRRADMALCIPCRTVSGLHAEIYDQQDHLLLLDMRSTNGTYVNGQRVKGQIVVRPDDLIQFADIPFRARRQSAASSCLTIHEDLCDHALALVEFDQLMTNRSVVPYYQPIVDLATHNTVGYEVLGRQYRAGS